MGQSAPLRPLAWQLDLKGPVVALRLFGDWIASETGVRSAGDVANVVRRTGVRRLRLDAGDLGKWTAR